MDKTTPPARRGRYRLSLAGSWDLRDFLEQGLPLLLSLNFGLHSCVSPVCFFPPPSHLYTFQIHIGLPFIHPFIQEQSIACFSWAGQT